MKSIIAAALFSVAVLVQGNASAAAAPSNAALIGELLEKSGFNKQLGEIGPAVEAGFDKGTTTLDESQRADLREAFRGAFATEALQDDANKNAPKLISPTTAKGAVTWLDSPLGERINALENAFGTAEGMDARLESAAALFKTLPSARIERYKRLATAVKVADAYATTFINTTLATARGIDSITKTLSEEKLADLRKKLEMLRPQLTERYLDEALVFFAGTYQTLEDKDLDRYIMFSETPAGRAYNASLIKLLDVVMTNASLEAGRRIADVKSKAGGT